MDSKKLAAIEAVAKYVHLCQYCEYSEVEADKAFSLIGHCFAEMEMDIHTQNHIMENLLSYAHTTSNRFNIDRENAECYVEMMQTIILYNMVKTDEVAAITRDCDELHLS